MPQTVLKAREIIADTKSDFKDLAALFETDQAIAAKILKVANSPYYGIGGKVSSIQRASVILGHKTLGEIISMGGASAILAKKLDGYGLDAGALWKHSLAVAFGARIIAQKTAPALLNDAFTSGLIHDGRGKLKVFAIDDSRMVLNIYRSVLHNLGCESRLFEFPVSAIERVDKEKPDLILTDLNMPDILGIELTREIRKKFAKENLPVVMVTTQDEERDNDAAYEAGINGILRKPFSETQIKNVIEQFARKIS